MSKQDTEWEITAKAVVHGSDLAIVVNDFENMIEQSDVAYIAVGMQTGKKFEIACNGSITEIEE